MGELLAVLIAALVLLAVPVALGFALVAWSRTRHLRGLEARLDRLERQQQLERLERAVAEPRPGAAVTPPETRPPKSEPAPDPVPAAEVASPSTLPPPASPAQVLPPRLHSPAARLGTRLRGFDWERLLGVRAAAVVGGLVLALAGLLFVQYSIQQGWVTASLRVYLAAGAGVLALGVSQWWFARGYAAASNALAGAGGVLLFGALWAGYRLYGLFGFGLAFPAMVAVSVLLALLSLGRPSRVVAVFGVLGGFATPLLVTLGAQQPLGLFGYLLALDLGLFALSRRRGWGLVGVLGALGSMAVFTAYVGLHFRSESTPLALGFVGASAAALCLPALLGARGGERPPLAGALVALAGSFPLALFVVARADFGQGLLPLALTAAVLVALAGVVARSTQFTSLSQGASLGALALILTWSLRADVDGPASWRLLGAMALLPLVPHLLAEWDRRRARAVQVLAAALLELGLAGVGVAVVLRSAQAHPLAILLWALLPAALLLRQAWLSGSTTLLVFAALPGGALGLALAVARGARALEPLTPAFSIALVALPLAFALHALLLRPSERRSAAWLSVAVSALLGLAALGLRAYAQRGSPLEFHLTCLALVVLASQACGRRGSTVMMAATVLGAALVYLGWATQAVPAEQGVSAALGLCTLALAALTSAPRARVGDAGTPVGPWVVAAAAPLLWMPALLVLVFDHMPARAQPLPAVLAALPALLLFARARRLAVDLPARRHALAASLGVALVLAASLPPLAFDRGVSAAAFSAVLLLALYWQRLPHRGLALAATLLCALGLAGMSFESLLAWLNESRWPRSGWPVLHWMSYGWLVPALCALGASAIFSRADAPARWSARSAGLCGLLLGFLWVNIEVQNHYMQGTNFHFDRRRLAERDFVTSCAWGLYALVLLVAGLRSRGSALRKASLVFLLAAIAKVFLRDLDTLTGLYRVGSLVGLAAALFAVSLCYQRFVFRHKPKPAPGEPSEA